MSDYRINFGSIIGASDTEKLSHMLGVVDFNDGLNISLEACDEDQADGIISVLNKNGFDVVSKGADNREKYNIIAKRR